MPRYSPHSTPRSILSHQYSLSRDDIDGMPMPTEEPKVHSLVSALEGLDIRKGNSTTTPAKLSNPASGYLSPNHKDDHPVDTSDEFTGAKLPGNTQYDKLYTHARECFREGNQKEGLTLITQAKRLIDRGDKLANPKLKIKVYYTYSQFLTIIKQSEKQSLKPALDSIEEAIYICKNSPLMKDKLEYYQDCLVHKAFLLPYFNKNDESKDLYKEAFQLNPIRFVEEYTSEATGKELLFWATYNDTPKILEKLVEIKAENKEDNLNPNVEDSGLSVLLVAVMENKKAIIDNLLKLGANPLYKIEGHDSPLEYALIQQDWELSCKFIEYIQTHKGDIGLSYLTSLQQKLEETDIEEDMPEDIHKSLTTLLREIPEHTSSQSDITPPEIQDSPLGDMEHTHTSLTGDSSHSDS